MKALLFEVDSKFLQMADQVALASVWSKKAWLSISKKDFTFATYGTLCLGVEPSFRADGQPCVPDDRRVY